MWFYNGNMSRRRDDGRERERYEHIEQERKEREMLEREMRERERMEFEMRKRERHERERLEREHINERLPIAERHSIPVDAPVAVPVSVALVGEDETAPVAVEDFRPFTMPNTIVATPDDGEDFMRLMDYGGWWL